MRTCRYYLKDSIKSYNISNRYLHIGPWHVCYKQTFHCHNFAHQFLYWNRNNYHRKSNSTAYRILLRVIIIMKGVVNRRFKYYSFEFNRIVGSIDLMYNIKYDKLYTIINVFWVVYLHPFSSSISLNPCILGIETAHKRTTEKWSIFLKLILWTCRVPAHLIERWIILTYFCVLL